jgi:hypothetical protein
LARTGSQIRGARVGSGPRGDMERGEPADRIWIDYFCAQGHRCAPGFAAEAQIPEHWVCPRCGQPAGRDRDNPPAIAPASYKTHLACVRERRTDEDAEILLNEALARLRNS